MKFELTRAVARPMVADWIRRGGEAELKHDFILELNQKFFASLVELIEVEETSEAGNPLFTARLIVDSPAGMRRELSRHTRQARDDGYKAGRKEGANLAALALMRNVCQSLGVDVEEIKGDL